MDVFQAAALFGAATSLVTLGLVVWRCFILPDRERRETERLFRFSPRVVVGPMIGGADFDPPPASLKPITEVVGEMKLEPKAPPD